MFVLPRNRAVICALALFGVGGCGVIVLPAFATPKYTRYVNMVQDARGVYMTGTHRTVLMRYPCGRVGLWSIDQGEIADCVSRGLRLYPCLGGVTNKDNSDWRDTIRGDPSQMEVRYRKDSPASGASVELTVTPHVSCYRYRLPAGPTPTAIVMTTVDVPALMSWNWRDRLKWTNNVIEVVDPQTVELIVSGFKKATVYYYVRFSAPAIGHGVLQWTNVAEGLTAARGDRLGAFLKFRQSNVVAAVAVSHTSMAQARKYFEAEFGDMDFDRAVAELERAWEAKLGRVEAAGPELRLRQLYTALYTVYANIIDVTDNPFYSGYKPLLSIASSDYWQYIGGYMRCNWDQSRAVYPLLVLIDPEVLAHVLNTYLAQYERDGAFAGNWDPFVDQKGAHANYAANMALLAWSHGVEGVDYARFKAAAVATAQRGFDRDFFELGYIPTGKGNPNCGSHTLENAARSHGLALFGRVLGDAQVYEQFWRHRTNYIALFDPTEKRFRTRIAQGAWGELKGGFFEGSGQDWVFAVPHDPYGLFALYGVNQAVSDIESYVSEKSDFNDYKLIYPYLPVFADRADVTQRLIRNNCVPRFDRLTMAEWVFKSGDQGCYYTSNAGFLACSILGLYWVPTAGSTWVIATPSVDRYTLNGVKRLTVQTLNNSPSNHYIRSIQLDGVPYPSYLISGRVLSRCDHAIMLELTNNPCKLGTLYLSSTEGEVLRVASDGRRWIEFELDPIATTCRAYVFSATVPQSVTLGGISFTNWSYNDVTKLVTLSGLANGVCRIKVR